MSQRFRRESGGGDTGNEKPGDIIMFPGSSGRRSATLDRFFASTMSAIDAERAGIEATIVRERADATVLEAEVACREMKIQFARAMIQSGLLKEEDLIIDGDNVMVKTQEGNIPLIDYFNKVKAERGF